MCAITPVIYEYIYVCVPGTGFMTVCIQVFSSDRNTCAHSEFSVVYPYQKFMTRS